MDQQQALTVLVQAAQVAQSKGAFTLQEAGVVAEAIAAFNTAPPEVEAPKEDDKSDSSESQYTID
jgi:hypothetical protein